MPFCGRTYELLAATCARRARRDLYHAALLVELDGERYAIEVGPSRDADTAGRGVSPWAPSATAGSAACPSRYEVRCCGRTIPDSATPSAAPCGSPPIRAPRGACSPPSPRCPRPSGAGTSSGSARCGTRTPWSRGRSRPPGSRWMSCGLPRVAAHPAGTPACTLRLHPRTRADVAGALGERRGLLARDDRRRGRRARGRCRNRAAQRRHRRCRRLPRDVADAWQKARRGLQMRTSTARSPATRTTCA